MMKVEVRKAAPQDAPAIAEIHVKTWQFAYKGQMPDSYLDSLSVQKRTEGWKKRLENPENGTHVLVGIINEQLVGWSTGGVSRDEDAPKEIGELYAIYVHPDFMNHGVGSKLIAKMLTQLKKDSFKKATLWVLDTNKKTRSWYEARGWIVEGGKKVEHRDGFDLNEIRYIIDL